MHVELINAAFFTSEGHHTFTYRFEAEPKFSCDISIRVANQDGIEATFKRGKENLIRVLEMALDSAKGLPT